MFTAVILIIVLKSIRLLYVSVMSYRTSNTPEIYRILNPYSYRYRTVLLIRVICCSSSYRTSTRTVQWISSLLCKV